VAELRRVISSRRWIRCATTILLEREEGRVRRESVRELVEAVRPRYGRAARTERGRILDEFCAVTGYHQTVAYRKAMRKRSAWVEPLFGEAKQWHGLHRFRLRGLAKANSEGLRVAAGRNLKRWLAAQGWGRRLAPCGRLLAQSRHRSALPPVHP
jgi:hypothetical protein